MLSPASPPGPALGPALREGLKLGPGPSPTFKARARPELVFLGPDPSLILMRCCSMHILWSKINRTVTTREVLESFSSSINSMLAMLDLTFSWRDLLTKHRSSSLSACACSSWQGLEASSVVFSFFKTRN